MQQCLRLDANERPTCSHLLKLEFFTRDNFATRFPQEIRAKILKETEGNPLLRNRNGSKDDADSKDKENKDKENGKKKRREHRIDKTVEKTKVRNHHGP